MLVADKRKEAKKLEDVGVGRPKAEATVEMTISIVEKHAATKADLENLATKTDVAETNAKIDAARAEFYKSMTAGFDKLNDRASETDKSMTAGFDKLNESISKTNERVSETKAEIATATATIIKWVVGIVLTVATLQTAAFALWPMFAGG